jgi:putative endonuclease
MHYVYILRSEKDNGLYIGCTNDLKRRFAEHNDQKSLSTKNRAPFVLIHYEAFLLNSDARAREKYLKSGYGRQQLKSILRNTFLKLKIDT